ncbi:MAG: hypothetical protein EHM48_09555, partial [Planctomycetaceae bacterium]
MKSMKSMRSGNILMTLGVAVVTMVITVLAFWPSELTAVGTDGAKPAKVEVPTLNAAGVMVTAKPMAEKVAPGEPIKLELNATNTTDATAQVIVKLNLSSQSVASTMSRVLVMPTSIYNKDIPLSLQAGQSVTMPLEITPSELKAEPQPETQTKSQTQSKKTSGDQMVTITLSVGKASIRAGQFTLSGTDTHETTDAVKEIKPAMEKKAVNSKVMSVKSSGG